MQVLLIHTARAFVFVPLSVLLFVYNSSGLLLWAAIALIIGDAYLELIDILEERKSRASFGGIYSMFPKFKVTVCSRICPGDLHTAKTQLLK